MVALRLETLPYVRTSQWESDDVEGRMGKWDADRKTWYIMMAGKANAVKGFNDLPGRFFRPSFICVI